VHVRPPSASGHPNADFECAVRAGGSYTLRAACPLPAGAEVTISYAPRPAPPPLRPSLNPFEIPSEDLSLFVMIYSIIGIFEITFILLPRRVFSPARSLVIHDQAFA